jgi:ankyrin repeat protein
MFALVCNNWQLRHNFEGEKNPDEGSTALIIAAKRGRLAVVKTLLAAGANAHARNGVGNE